MPGKKPKQPGPPLASENIPETSSIRAIKYLTCQGVGMQGIGYIGAIEELERCGVLAQLEEVAGNSASGAVAALLAVGCTAREIKQAILGFDFETLAEKGNEGWLEASRIKDFIKGGGLVAKSISDRINALKKIPLLGHVLKQAAEPYSEYVLAAAYVLDHMGEGVSKLEKMEEVVGVTLGYDLNVRRGEGLKNRIAGILAQKTGNPNITFSELAALSKTANSRMKRLTLTGSNLSTGQLEYYNARNTPDMPVLDAVQISIGFPFGVKPVVVDGQVKLDGSLLENLPDVFNQPPYLTPENTNEFGGNSEAFALVFNASRADETSEVKAGEELAKALYSETAKDKAVQKKYGKQIAYIHSEGVTAFEYHASKSKKEALIASGGLGIRNSVRSILRSEKSEEQLDYGSMSVPELIRRERAWLHLPDRQKNQNSQELNRIRRALDAKDVSEDRLEALQRKEEARYLKRQALKNPKILPVAALSEECAAKNKELERTERQLKRSVQRLKIAKRALQMHRDEVVARYQANFHDNDFYRDLLLLKQNEENLAGVTNKKERIAFIALQNEAIQQLINKYKRKNDMLISDFFEMLLKDCQRWDFKVPTTKQELLHYHSQDIRSCQALLEQRKQDIQKTQKEMDALKRYQKYYQDTKEKSEKLIVLHQLKMELDTSLARKSSLLTKIEFTLAQKAPKLEKVILPFLKLVSVAAFLCWLPLAIPFVPIAKTIQRFSNSSEVQSTLDRFISFFRWTDLDVNKKIQGLQQTTAECIRKLQKNYTKSDKEEHAYIYRLHSIFLKNSGLALEDFVKKQRNETPEEYRARIEQLKKKLEIVSASERVLREDTTSNQKEGKEATKKVNQSVLNFKKAVLKNVLKMNATHLNAERKELRNPSFQKPSQAQLAAIAKQNIQIIHLEALNQLDQKLKRDPEYGLTDAEILEYRAISKAVARPLSPLFLEQFGEEAPENEEKVKRQPKKEHKSAKPHRKEAKRDPHTQRALRFFHKERKPVDSSEPSKPRHRPSK